MDNKRIQAWLLRAGAALLVAVFLVGLLDSSVILISIVETILYFSILYLGYRYGTGTGAVAGTICGMIQTIRMEDMAPLGMLAVMGALGGLFRSLGRFGSGLAYILGALSVGFLYAPGQLQNFIPEFLSAIAIFLIIPNGLVSNASATSKETGQEVKHCEEMSARTLANMSQTFLQLSKALTENRSMAWNSQGEIVCELPDAISWRDRFFESQAAISDQFSELSHILDRVADQMLETKDVTASNEARIRKSLRFKQIKAENIIVLEHGNKRQEAYLTLSTKNGRYITVKEVAEILSKSAGRRFKPSLESKSVISKDASTIHFEEEPEYQVLHGVARAVKAGEELSGDTFSVTPLPMGRMLLCLSDGMGSGQAAFMESEVVVDLAEQLLNAGFSLAATVRLINSVLLLRGDEQKPTTIDMGVFDLYEGTFHLVKLGACSTFIRHQGAIETLDCNQLPLGMFQETSANIVECPLNDGDVLVMMTDGVLEAFPGEDKTDAVKQFLNVCQKDNPKDLAERLLKAALGEDEPWDDMTILVAGLWKK